MTTAAEKAACRAGARRKRVAELHAAGQHRDALAEAVRGLRAEAAKAERRLPDGAEQLYRHLTDRITQLAEAVPTFRPRT